MERQTKGTRRLKINIPITEKIITKYLGILENPNAQALLSLKNSGQSVVLESGPIHTLPGITVIKQVKSGTHIASVSLCDNDKL